MSTDPTMPANDTAGDEREADRIRVSDYRNNRISNVHLLCAAFDRLLTAAEYERDEALANHQRVLANNERLHAERDALAAKLAEAQKDNARLSRLWGCDLGELLDNAMRADERDAAIARAESAEAKLADRTAQCDAMAQRLSIAVTRAAALAEALRDLHQRVCELDLSPLAVGETLGLIGAYPRSLLADRVRAALAGNGTGGDGWIACSERMPEPDEPVICYTNAGFRTVGRRIHMGWTLGFEGDMTDPEGVTHWRPLPAPPSAGETKA